MSRASGSKIGRILFVIANLSYTIGAFVADFNETHVYNSLWPPHARFHNGQTMTLSVLLGAVSLWLVFRSPSSRQERQHDLLVAAIISSFYCGAGLSAILYPGTSWADPPHETAVKGAQGYVFAVQIALVWIGYSLESRSMGALKSK